MHVNIYTKRMVFQAPTVTTWSCSTNMYNDNSETCLQAGLDACADEGFDGPVDATFTDEDIEAIKIQADGLGTGKEQ